MTADSIRTVSEHDATGIVAEIYAEIRQTMGIPLVNLIWRHLASHPPGLQWAWSLLKPAYESGKVEAAAWAMRGELDVPGSG